MLHKYLKKIEKQMSLNTPNSAVSYGKNMKTL